MAKIGIIGGGFTGLGTAYFLEKFKGHEITLIEKDRQLGGLSAGFKKKEWEWHLDKLIHHWFSTDRHALNIAKEIGLGKKLIFKNTLSSCYYNGNIAQLDTPMSLLKFPFLSFIGRIRLALMMALLRVDNNYLRYENKSAVSFIRRMAGDEVFNVLWKPLFSGKFGKNAKDVNAAWFWARVHPRTKKLAYIEGGFQAFIDRLAEVLKSKGIRIKTEVSVEKIKKRKDGKFEIFSNEGKFEFDAIVLTVPLEVALKLYDFPEDYKKKYSQFKSIGAQYFALELDRQFLKDGTYWLNVNDEKFPFMMVAEHTNFVNKSHYGNSHLIWVGKYLDYGSPLWKLNKKDLLEKIIPCLKKINHNFDASQIKESFFFRFRDAQPILTTNYSKKMPKIETPVENLYTANMNHIYPWDRGTNNALELGFRTAKKIKSHLAKSSD